MTYKVDIGSIETLRERLQRIAYTLLKSPEDAEDVVQDAFLRWHRAGLQCVRSTDAWMITAARHLCIDRIRLQARERKREIAWRSAQGTPARDPTGNSAELIAAFLTMLERLSYADRAALVVHDVFGYSYDEMALIFMKTNDACRQIVRRAKMRVTQHRTSSETHTIVVPQRISRFVDAIRDGNIAEALSSMALTSRDRWAALTLIRRCSRAQQ